MAWLRENDVVKKLLRANLHQKQYVDQVPPSFPVHAHCIPAPAV